MCRQRPELAFYLITLWMAAWHSHPAASLEDDDSILSNLAMCDPARWSEVRSECLRGWIKCSDRRLYHPFLSLKAPEVWTHSERFRRAQSEKGKKSALARLKNKGNSDNHGSTGVEPQPNHGSTPVQPNSTNRREEKRREEKKKSHCRAADAASSEGPTATPSPWTFGLHPHRSWTHRKTSPRLGRQMAQRTPRRRFQAAEPFRRRKPECRRPCGVHRGGGDQGQRAGAAAPRELSAAEKRGYLRSGNDTGGGLRSRPGSRPRACKTCGTAS